MAVERPERPKAPVPRIQDYWPRFQQRSVWLILGMQFVATALVGIALLGANVFDMGDPVFWIVMLATSAAAIGVNLMVFWLISEPMKALSVAVAHAAGEDMRGEPLPNQNAKRYEKNGFKEMLQTIYELGSGHHDETPADTATKSTADDIVTEGLGTTSGGLLIYDTTLTLLYGSPHAPTHIDQNGQLVADLIFDQQNSLEAWVTSCKDHVIHASKTWTRIANRLPGEEGRVIYDIVASYQQGSSAPVVLMLFDRTSLYTPEEDDLDFIAFAAHELRGPITVIRGYLDVLQDELSGSLHDDQAELLSRLIVSANRLSSYVNNILNTSRYDRRHLKVNLREESIASIYDTINDDMQLRASAQNRLLSVHFADDLPSVAADRGSISEVLGNLIDNAIKYSNEGGAVSVTAVVRGDFVEVSITDHGIGIPSNVIGNLFHKFYRSHRSRETVAGTGIGLYICKAIVESHGGQISVSSVEGEGSTFTFSLPIYATVADKLQSDNNSNESLIEHGTAGWIKNHTMYRG